MVETDVGRGVKNLVVVNFWMNPIVNDALPELQNKVLKLGPVINELKSGVGIEGYRLEKKILLKKLEQLIVRSRYYLQIQKESAIEMFHDDRLTGSIQVFNLHRTMMGRHG